MFERGIKHGLARLAALASDGDESRSVVAEIRERVAALERLLGG